MLLCGASRRPGPRLLQGTGILARLLHGEDVGRVLGDELAPKHWLPIHAPTAAELASATAAAVDTGLSSSAATESSGSSAVAAAQA